MTRSQSGHASNDVRRAHALPLSWNVPGPAAIGRLRARLNGIADRRRTRSALVTIEAAVLVVLSMQTGKERHVLLDAQRASDIVSAKALPETMVIMTPASILLRNADGVEPILVPQTRLLNRLMAMLPPMTCTYAPVFSSRHKCILRAAREIIRGEGDWRADSVKANRSLSAHCRWLSQRIRIVSKGDAGISAVLNPGSGSVNRVLSAYCAVPQKKLVRHYHRAIKPLDDIVPLPTRAADDEPTVGRSEVPGDAQVRDVVASMRRVLARPIRSGKNTERLPQLGHLPVLIHRHNAMMLYTFILATFGTGQRGKREPCGEKSIARGANFAWVLEKDNARIGLAGQRGVFHCRTVRHQLARYEDYLDVIERMLKDEERKSENKNKHLAAALSDLRRTSDQLVFFDIIDDEVVLVSTRELCERGKALGWPFCEKAGRRWLRSKLTGEIPSDALAAQFGHNIDGLDVWSAHSGLRVAELAPLLGPAIEGALNQIGLVAAPSHPPKRRPAMRTGPNVGMDPDNHRARSGQILASLIWHGALLDKSQHMAALAALSRCLTGPAIPQWIELDPRRGCVVRWSIDPTTRKLLVRYRRKSALRLAQNADLVMEEFLGSSETYNAFMSRASEHWRYRLPPMLFAKATGKLRNYNLPTSRFGPDAKFEKKAGSHLDRSTGDLSEAAADFIDWFEAHWHVARHRPRVKKELHDQLMPALPEQSWWLEMTELERWLAQASIASLQADRTKQNPRGFAPSTVLDRAGRVFGSFARNAIHELKQCGLDQWKPSDLQRFLPRPPLRSDIANDLVELIKTSMPKGEREHLVSLLEEVAENHKEMLVYETVFQQTLACESWDARRVAWLLCYRTGLRLDELAHLSANGFIDEGNSFILRLDHRKNRRLKTFHSRRIIPLDVLLDAEELHQLRQLLAKRKGLLYYWRDVERSSFHYVLGEVLQQRELSAFALRHSFATNAYCALLWPETDLGPFAEHFDAALFSRRKQLRERLCGKASLGAIAPHALANVMGHTSPSRTLLNYAHNLEIILAAHVASWAKFPQSNKGDRCPVSQVANASS